MSTPFVGQIGLFGFPFAPRGWHLCDGSLLAISSNQALFALIGTFYGGNGTSTFGLPDLRSRVVVGQGTGPGLPTYTVGQSGGAVTQSLTASNLPPHTHPATLQVASSARGNPVAAAAGYYLAGPAPTYFAPGTPPESTITLGVSSVTVQPNTGTSIPISILEPFQCLNYCIALLGIFPSRS